MDVCDVAAIAVLVMVDLLFSSATVYTHYVCSETQLVSGLLLCCSFCIFHVLIRHSVLCSARILFLSAEI